MLYADPFLTVYCCLLAALLGACMGSFSELCSLAHRPWGERAAWPVPLRRLRPCAGGAGPDPGGQLSGRPRTLPATAGAKLSRRHVLAEAVSALVFVTLLLHYDISLQALEGWCVAGILLVCSFADLEGYIIPRPFYSGRRCAIYHHSFLRPPAAPAGAGQHHRRSGGGGVRACFWCWEWRSLLGREAMGGGDIKLLFLTGLFLGWKRNLLCLVTACVIGIVWGLLKKTGRRRGHPVGPQHRPWRLADGAVRPTDHRLVSGAAVILESEDEHFGKDRWL